MNLWWAPERGLNEMSKKRSYLQSTRQWLSPGMRVKRWALLLVLGSALVGIGLVYLLFAAYRAGLVPAPLYDWLVLGFLPLGWRVALPLLLGIGILFLAVVRLGGTLLEPFKRPGDSLAASLYDHSRRSRGPYVVAIGGGTGLPSLLRGLKQYTSNITAILTVADDGGSSGRLRQELGLLPPGDFRNNIGALSQDEALMTQLLQYRFARSSGANGQRELAGHAFGNLLLAALAGVTGSFDEALLAAERVLAMRGRVLPSTLEQVTLVADVVEAGGDGQARRIVGESRIPEAGGRIRRVYLDPGGVRAYPPAVQAILQADLVVIGPGSLYTSILPNLLVRDVAQALRHTGAPTVYVCNLATQPGETDGYSVVEHVEVIIEQLGDNCLDFVVANNNVSPPGETIGRTVFVEPSWPPARASQTRLISADLVDEVRPWRHDSEKLARVVLAILEGDNRLRL